MHPLPELVQGFEKLEGGAHRSGVFGGVRIEEGISLNVSDENLATTGDAADPCGKRPETDGERAGWHLEFRTGWRRRRCLRLDFRRRFGLDLREDWVARRKRARGEGKDGVETAKRFPAQFRLGPVQWRRGWVFPFRSIVSEKRNGVIRFRFCLVAGEVSGWLGVGHELFEKLGELAPVNP